MPADRPAIAAWSVTLLWEPLGSCTGSPNPSPSGSLVLALRMTGGIAANLTVNEMENAHRYEYLQEPDEGASAFARAEKTSSNETREAETLETLAEEKPPKGYVNPFDRGRRTVVRPATQRDATRRHETPRDDATRCHETQ